MPPTPHPPQSLRASHVLPFLVEIYSFLYLYSWRSLYLLSVFICGLSSKLFQNFWQGNVQSDFNKHCIFLSLQKSISFNFGINAKWNSKSYTYKIFWNTYGLQILIFYSVCIQYFVGTIHSIENKNIYKHDIFRVFQCAAV